MSSDPDQSYSTVRSIQLESPISSRKAWKEIQESCEDCLMAIGHIKSGTKIRWKEKNRYNVRKLINKATIAEDGLLVIMEQFPMELKPIETIVVPRDFSLSVVTLLHSEESNQHPSASQMLELTKRKYYIFNREKVIQEVCNSCLQGTARKKMSPSIVSLKTEMKSDCPGTYFNADAMIRNK